MTPQEIEALPYRPCVGVMLANAQGNVFVAQRIDSQVPAWQMPQGGIDAGETPKAAALRELTEETGVTPDLVTVIDETPDWVNYDLPHELVPKLWKGRFRGQKQKWFLMRFHGSDTQIDITQPPAEFSTWRWLAFDRVAEEIVPFKRHVYQAVAHAFRAHF